MPRLITRPWPRRCCQPDRSARDRVAEAAKLVGSLKAKGVLMLPAERHLFQARSALAVSAYSDVERLCAQSTAAAREQEADFEDSQAILARCEETIAKAIEAGRNTLADALCYQSLRSRWARPGTGGDP